MGGLVEAGETIPLSEVVVDRFGTILEGEPKTKYVTESPRQMIPSF